jgi:VIT1/CCC1 family predicted Fe2+/Mn2+ transporter
MQLLMVVLILGVVAYVVSKLTIASPFKEVAWGILIIILIIVLFRAIPALNLP